MIKYISQQLNLSEKQIRATIDLLDEGATVPFISRYRKERTGNLDEVQIGAIQQQAQKWKELDSRRKTILQSIEKQGLLTDDLKRRIDSCLDLVALEDIYLPFKPKRRTRATIAREQGLEPLAKLIMKQELTNPEQAAGRFCSDQINDVADAIKGAQDIIAEWICEDERTRQRIRHIFQKHGILESKKSSKVSENADKYRDYFEWQELGNRCPSHRFLAMNRAANEGALRLTIHPDEEIALPVIKRLWIKNQGACSPLIEEAINDGYKRLLMPAMETEQFHELKEKSDREAIRVFTENLRQLLLSAPLGAKRVLAIDPGFRTGCKVVCLDEQGSLLHNETVYPHKPQEQTKQASRKISSLIDAYQIQAVAIGNGTAGRETENFMRRLKLNREVKVFVVSEDGASIYSASSVAREEFPQYDVTVRGSVSIGRRLMDPLAELVKLDPKSIGVGQYQHDVDQKLLKDSLTTVVVSVVNKVGVNLNTASRHLLEYVSGLGTVLAQNIVDYRKENGPFKSRKDLLKVPRMGAKTFQQAAGFLRIPDAKNPLDQSAVHPESYSVVEKMAKDLNCSVEMLVQDESQRAKIVLENYITEKTGMPTLTDILDELAKPGLDPREQIKVFEFDPSVYKIDDLKEGMILPGIVTNLTRFGAFVDLGVKQDGLIHISEMADRFINDPSEILHLHQQVKVRVLEVDSARKRIQLSLKNIEAN